MKTLIITITFLFFASIASACSCLKQELHAAFAGSSMVIKGKVIAVQQVKSISADTTGAYREYKSNPQAADMTLDDFMEQMYSNWNTREFSIKVKRSFKGGPKKGSIIKVRTAGDSAACGYNFELKKTYTIFGYGLYESLDLDDKGKFSILNAHYTTDLCTRTALWKYSKKDKKFLKNPPLEVLESTPILSDPIPTGAPGPPPILQR